MTDQPAFTASQLRDALAELWGDTKIDVPDLELDIDTAVEAWQNDAAALTALFDDGDADLTLVERTALGIVMSDGPWWIPLVACNGGCGAMLPVDPVMGSAWCGEINCRARS